ncbi:site-specific integrase [Streptomyces sp. NPDC002088]|uniref:tyrosine-type recombinase/integrase n=1 Tax=Streptomyces sp. NPDC002088 TaxID=3154665 RepID=UPI00331AEE8B
MRFPPRSRPATWATTAESRDEILARIDRPPLRTRVKTTHEGRRYGARKILSWLESFPGTTWQERWQASPANLLGLQWTDPVMAWLTERGESARKEGLRAGLLCLCVADVIRPDLEFLLRVIQNRHWREAVVKHRDPAGFARLEEAADPVVLPSRPGLKACTQIALIVLAKGGGVGDITVGDCIELRQTEARNLKKGGDSRFLFYALLKDMGQFPPDAPSTLRALTVFSGQLTPAELVDRYQLACRPVRDLIVDYLSERQPALDYASFEDLAGVLALHFWKNLETHHPGIASLHDRDAAMDWKERLRTKVSRRRMPDGTTVEVTTPRASYASLLGYVRAFYLDIAQWALEDPARWGPWAVPSPISANEISYKKDIRRRKARMDQRTRERLPVLPVLVSAAEKCLHEARIRKEALRATPGGHSFTVLGVTFTKATRSSRLDSSGSTCAYDESGRRHSFTQDEHRAFWGWAAIEFLRHTGVRIEEMLETSHHSITQYTLPTTGELIPLLQIAPSKTDEERLLVVSPELADVLSAIVSRVRDASGAIPLAPFYDGLEKIWNPPAPLLFQWTSGGQRRAVSSKSIRKALNEILRSTGLTDAAGQPLHYQPHDFRRIFTTEAIMNGMPPHITQLILGHKDINTTMGYKAVYPEEAINGHRASIARRRALRPSEEYRTPTDEEWNEFLGHFERRKVALGDCGRAYGTICQHEHSCVRCPVLRVDPAQRHRLEEIRNTLTDRITEAEHEGWLGEAEGLRVSLAATESKLAQLDERQGQATSISLGIPTFREIAGRTATLPTGNPATGTT